jgi:hypothetical protein
MDDSRRSELLALQQQLDNGKFADFFYQFCIIFIAIIKVFGIILLEVFNNFILYMPFAVIYLIVAYVHLKHTGYYFAYTGTESAIAKEYKKFAHDGYKAKIHSQPIETKTPIRNTPIKHNPHEIIQDGQKPNNYLLKTKGILTDDDIINLISGQDDDNKIALFKACRKHQMENLLTQTM